MLGIPPADPPYDDVTQHVLDVLRCCGDLTVHVVTDACAGERDPRVVIRRDHPAVTVELLTDQDVRVPPECWHAVRIAADGRCVWRGPRRDSGTDLVLRFVDDLLRMPPGSLLQRYQRLG